MAKRKSAKPAVNNDSGTSRLVIAALGIVAIVFVLTTSLLASHLPDADGVGGGSANNGAEIPGQPGAHENEHQELLRGKQQQSQDVQIPILPEFANGGPSYLFPPLPYLPPHASVSNKETLIAETLLQNKPTVAGVHAVLQNFFVNLHQEFHRLKLLRMQDRKKLRNEVHSAYQNLVKKHLIPLDSAYRGRPIFEIREDDSIFCSLASFRDHLLGATLKEAFRKAKNPDKLFVGAVVQNCFGDEYTCRTGVQVVGTRPDGKPMTKVSDTVPDKNGIDEFCNDEEYKKYCQRGQIRALYVNETEALGPAVARYHASKLWGGETFYMQADAHLRFAPNWDARYVEEVKAAKSYPKAVLSAYPPGFQEEDKKDYVGGTTGSRLCYCEFSSADVEEHIIRINAAGHCKDQKAPTQIAFIAAGFFFARAEFLTDVPFDPYLPWTFMGEEIALSMRAWTSGWDIYAPRQNLIAHQYRPGRMGLPKFWGSVGQTFDRPGAGFSNFVQSRIIKRVKHLVGYEAESLQAIQAAGDESVLEDLEHYGLGTKRTKDEYFKLTNIDVVNMKCGRMQWCSQCQLE